MVKSSAFRGGMRWGIVNLTWPFVRLFINGNQLILNSFLGRKTFNRSDIEMIASYDGIFSKGIQIRHSVSKYPTFVVFWTFERDRVMEALKAWEDDKGGDTRRQP